MRSFLFLVFWRCPCSRGFAPLTEGGMCDSIPKQLKNSLKITCSILWPSETKRANDPSDTRTLQISQNIQRKIFISTPAFLVGYSIILRSLHWLSSVSGGYRLSGLSGTSGATTEREPFALHSLIPRTHNHPLYHEQPLTLNVSHSRYGRLVLVLVLVLQLPTYNQQCVEHLQQTH